MDIKKGLGLLVILVLAGAGVWYAATQMPQAEEMGKEDIELEGLTLFVPGVGAQIEATLSASEVGDTYTASFSVEGEEPVSGTIAATTEYVTSVTQEGGEARYIVPFTVNYEGIGEILYVGLFVQVEGGYEHSGSLGVGSGVELTSITPGGAGETFINFMMHHAGQELTDEPMTPASIVATIADEGIGVRRRIEGASLDIIQVTDPESYSAVEPTFTVSGEARGPWFFEASFPIEIYTLNGELIGQGIATAEGEWMTEELVPFEATVELEPDYAGPVVLTLVRSNASGLPENDARLLIPVLVEPTNTETTQ
jgi:hypothetical protein